MDRRKQNLPFKEGYGIMLTQKSVVTAKDSVFAEEYVNAVQTQKYAVSVDDSVFIKECVSVVQFGHGSTL